ncbi:hypothetical protein BLNAU_84 [Blattamonas nauphoetae]|uniref:Glutaredoxin domain-containing protein n=1 Tax=Blattamonas nauphoetae TaxID=2049346 RepID=A0ABQ9YLZ5_9EUKA|nr:hypothetical protein BLNAU_84 [Blattamonas nauphoetae]
MILPFLILPLFSEEIFTGIKFVDEIFLESPITIIISMGCAECKEVIKLFEDNNLNYNVLQSMAMGDSFPAVKAQLAKLGDIQDVDSVIPAVIARRHYIGGLQDVKKYLETGLLKEIVDGTLIVGHNVFTNKSEL